MKEETLQIANELRNKIRRLNSRLSDIDCAVYNLGKYDIKYKEFTSLFFECGIFKFDIVNQFEKDYILNFLRENYQNVKKEVNDIEKELEEL